MNDTNELVILVKIVPRPGQELTDEDYAQAVEWFMAEMAGEIEGLLAAEAAARARRAARYRAATQPCPN
jgi:hypothetical protein